MGKKIVWLIIITLFLGSVNACSKSTGAEEGKVDEAGTYLALDQFTINLASPDVLRFIRVSMVLELSHSSLAEKAKMRTAPIREAIIFLVSSKTPDDLLSKEGESQLKDQLLARVNQILSEGTVKNIYFTDFAMN